MSNSACTRLDDAIADVLDGTASAEVSEHLSPLARRLSLVVVNDRSTDGTGEILRGLVDELPGLVPIDAEVNRGHGPTALAAYRAGLDLVPDLVLHVDGDGQFHGADLARVVRAAVSTGADVVHGVRRGRDDPLGVAARRRPRVPSPCCV